MRDSNNKSIPANKAAVSITSSLYDRRALDCTEDKPLVNSLNHLTVLASSSVKVREALAQDGGLERLVDILHECHNPQTEAQKCVFAWKWVLAFQSLVLVGTRGSEKMRRKVVEAGILPIVSTILDNYLITRKMAWVSQCKRRYPQYESYFGDSRQPELGSSSPQPAEPAAEPVLGTTQQPSALAAAGAPFNDTQMNTVFRQVRNLMDQADQTLLETEVEIVKQDKAAAAKFGDRSEGPPMEADQEYKKVYKCVDFVNFLHRLNTMEDIECAGNELMAHYEDLVVDPVFSNQLAGTQDISNLLKLTPSWTSTMPFISKAEEKLNQSVPREFQNGVLVPKEDDVVWALQLLAFISKYTTLRYGMADTYIVNGLSLRNYSVPPPLVTDSGLQPDDMLFDDCDYFEFVPTTPPDDPFTLFPHFNNDQCQDTCSQSSTMSLPKQLPALEVDTASNKSADYAEDLMNNYYDLVQEPDKLVEAQKLVKLTLDISRQSRLEYSRLRQRNREVYQRRQQEYAKKWDYNNSFEEFATPAELSSCMDNEIRPMLRLNLFPLVEKFTVWQLYSKDIKYWSSVIVRNSNRKDENRGGCRQCAFFGCGKWETTPRQFAKCRRCKRAKYCSRECQSKAWAYHKYWCTVGSSSDGSSQGSDRHHHHHHHAQQVEPIQPLPVPQEQNQEQGNAPGAPATRQGFFSQ